MAYTGNGYVADDLDNIAIDGIGTAGVVVISFLTLIVLVALAVWFKKKGRMLSK